MRLSEKIKAPEGWKIKRLGDISKIKTGKSNSCDAVENGLYVFFDRSKEVKRSNKYLFNTTAIIIPGEGKEFLPRFFKGKFDLHQRVYAIFDFSKDVIPRYVYYYIINQRKYFERVAVGSTVKSLRLRHFKEMLVFLPSLPEQQKIAEILGSIDDQIENLMEQNKTLEEIAKTIFKRWFIDFEFPNEEGKPYKSSGGEFVDSELGKIPKGWRVGKLGEFVKVTAGKGIKRECINEKGLYPVLGANGEIGRTDTFLFDQRVIYTGRVGTLGNVFISEGKAWLSDNTLVIIPNEENLFYFVYFSLKRIKIENLNIGSTQPLIRQKDVKNLLLVIPSKSLLERFHRTTKLIFQKVNENNKQIQTLTQLRDTLLPKLITGEIRVKV